MRTATVDIACRYFHPVQDTNAAGEWKWHRYADRIRIEIPTAPNESMTVQLPTPFYSVNAAWTWKMVLTYDRQAWLQLRTPDGYAPVQFAPWRTSELWSQVTFDPQMHYGQHMMRGPWWFRWRVLDARDLRLRMMSTLDAIVASGDLDEIHRYAAAMRREIMMDALGGVVR